MTQPESPHAVKSAGRAVAAVLGASIGGLPGAAVGAVASDYIVELAGRSWNELAVARRRSVGAVIEAAANQLDAAPEDMLTRAHAETSTAQLLFDTLSAASETLFPWKVQSLARALAVGLADEARVDEERLIVRALEDLEPPHVRVMSVLSIAKSGNAATIEANVGLLDSGAVVPVLVRHGIAEEDSDARATWEASVREREIRSAGGRYPRHDATVYDPRYRLTRFGRRVLGYLGPTPTGMVIHATATHD